MAQKFLDALTRSVSGVPSRRHLLRGLAAAGLGWGAGQLPAGTAANTKGKYKPKTKKGLCTRNGSRCRKAGKTCKKTYCLSAPFTIEARWSQPADHDTRLFVPPHDEPPGAFHYITSGCIQAVSPCDEMRPFACMDGDETQTGDEITTIYALRPGTYEYWIGLAMSAPAGAVTILLKAANGRIVRQWSSPANASTQIQAAWHVFDVDGRHGHVTAIDDLLADRTLSNVHAPDIDVCPE